MLIEELKNKAISVVISALIKSDPVEFESEEENGGQTRATTLATDVIDALIQHDLIK